MPGEHRAAGPMVQPAAGIATEFVGCLVSALEPYFTDGVITLYHGKFEDVLPQIDVPVELAMP